MAFEAPNHTQTPNEFFDRMLPAITSMSELKVVLAIIRQTFGWHKEEDRISVTMFMKLTGLSRQGVLDGLAYAQEHKIIVQRRVGQNCFYRLLVVDKDEPVTIDITRRDGRWTLKQLYACRELGSKSPCCIYCGDPQAGSLDHWLPKSRGGSNDANNLVLACSTCNLGKSVMTGEEYIELIVERGWVIDNLDRSVPLTKKQSERLAKQSKSTTKNGYSLDPQKKTYKQTTKDTKRNRFLSGKYADDIQH